MVARGRVQGVFFRESTRRRAEAEGVSGWVSNRGDGAVEAVFEGDAGAVERLLEFVRGGPGHAEVTEIEVGEEPPEGVAGFRVK